MIIEKQVIHFSEYMQALRCELDTTLKTERVVHGITFTKDAFSFKLFHDTRTECFYLTMECTHTKPSDYSTEPLHASLHMLDKISIHELCTHLLQRMADEVRQRIESAFVKKTIESQDLMQIGAYIAAETVPNSLFNAQFVVNTPKAWGGQGYGILKLRVITGGKDELIYGLIGEVQECYADGTHGLPAQLPFIETNAVGLADLLVTTREWAALLRSAK